MEKWRYLQAEMKAFSRILDGSPNQSLCHIVNRSGQMPKN